MLVHLNFGKKLTMPLLLPMKRDFHFSDGIDIYKGMLASASEADKKAYIEKIEALHAARQSCYEAGTTH